VHYVVELIGATLLVDLHAVALVDDAGVDTGPVLGICIGFQVL
jgi:gamma-glutamyl-gamma-aminobutyrate hydrolase PuuD